MYGKISMPLDPGYLLGGLVVEISITFMSVLTFSPSANLTLSIYRLFGVSAAQAYVYMMNCRRDTFWFKALVSLVL